MDTFSIRAPSAAERDAHDDGAAATFTVLAQPATVFLRDHLSTLIRAPLPYLRAFRLALSHRPPGLRGVALAVAHFGESVVVAAQLKRRGIIHLHNHFANSAATVGLIASRIADVPWSFTMHGISETDYPAGVTLARKIEAAAAVMCVSWFGRAQGMRLVAPEHWDKMQIVRCGLLFGEMPSAIAPIDRANKIICVGRLSPEKGQAGLLRAFSKIRAIYPSVDLHFVGDGPDLNRLRQNVASLGLNDAVFFLGRLSEPDTLREICSARLLVLPSLMEGLPIVLLEAAALEVPVVAAHVAGIPELIENDVNGALFAPGDWGALTQRIEAMLEAPEQAGAMAADARRKVLRDFDVSKSATQLLAIFQSISSAAH